MMAATSHEVKNKNIFISSLFLSSCILLCSSTPTPPMTATEIWNSSNSSISTREPLSDLIVGIRVLQRNTVST